MRLVVAGATGRIGRLLARVWAETDLDVLWTSRTAGGPVLPEHAACRLTAPDHFAELIRAADVVLDLAGPTRAPGTNLHDQHVALFEAVAALAPCPVVTMSSSAVYGAGSDRREDGPTAPAAPYGAAKLEVEARVREVPGAVALRLGNVAGADALLGEVRPGKTVSLHQFPDGRTPIRSYLGPVTLARLLHELCRLALDEALPKVLNLCGPAPVEMAALLDAGEIPWEAVPAPPEALAELSLSPALLQTFVDLPADLADPRSIIAEWQTVTG